MVGDSLQVTGGFVIACGQLACPEVSCWFQKSAVRNGDSISNFEREVCFRLLLRMVGFTLFLFFYFYFYFLVWSWYLCRFIDSFFGNSHEVRLPSKAAASYRG